MRGPAKKWTAEDIEYLRRNYPFYRRSEIASYLGRTVRSVSEKAKRLRFVRSCAHFTKEEDNLLIEVVKKSKKAHYHTDFLGPVSKKLGRRISVLSSRLNKLGLTLRNASRIKNMLRGVKTYRQGGKRKFVHRGVVEHILGRPLSRDEIVHHIDLDKLNNNPHNLLLCKNKSFHRKVHLQLESIATFLLRRGVIVFSRSKNKYILLKKFFTNL